MQWLSQDVEHLIQASQNSPAYCPDALVIGSGYGGAVAALRFAEHGLAVAVLERGNEYLAGEFPTDLSQTGGFIRAELSDNTGASASRFSARANRRTASLTLYSARRSTSL